MDNVIYAKNKNKNHIPLNLMCDKVNNMLGMFLYLHIDIQNKHFVYFFKLRLLSIIRCSISKIVFIFFLCVYI